MKMTYREAMEIQEFQAMYYRQLIGRRGLKAIRRKTKPCPADLHPDTPIFVHHINELVPRGADFERYLGRRKGTLSVLLRSLDPLTFHWCEAKKNNKLYSS